MNRGERGFSFSGKIIVSVKFVTYDKYLSLHLSCTNCLWASLFMYVFILISKCFHLQMKWIHNFLRVFAPNLWNTNRYSGILFHWEYRIWSMILHHVFFRYFHVCFHVLCYVRSWMFKECRKGTRNKRK